MSVRQTINTYLAADPRLDEMWRAVRGAGALRAISVDVTRRCNLRCAGCYFFAEDMDANGEADDAGFEAFIAAEQARGTNFVTVLGGEPSLVPERLQALARAFRLMVVTNGLRPIPQDGLEDIAIGVSVWGDRITDRRLRGWDRFEPFERAFANHRDDPRVTWYLTLPAVPGVAAEALVEELVSGGQLVGFNFYGDLQALGGSLDHRQGFDGAREFILAMIARHPASIAFTPYLAEVISRGSLLGRRWGHATCASISADHPVNAERLRNSEPYSAHFRAFNPDLRSTRRCCVGETRDCATCYDVWAHMSWILLSLERHLECAEDFARWLATAYLFHGVARLVDGRRFRALLPELGRMHEPACRA